MFQSFGQYRMLWMVYHHTDILILIIVLQIICLLIVVIISKSLYYHLYLIKHPFQLKPTKFIKNVSLYSCLLFGFIPFYKIIEFILYEIDSSIIYWAQAISIIQHISL